MKSLWRRLWGWQKGDDLPESWNFLGLSDDGKGGQRRPSMVRLLMPQEPQRVKEIIAGINFIVWCGACAHSAVKGHLSRIMFGESEGEQKQKPQRIMELRCVQLTLLSWHGAQLSGSRTGTDLEPNPKVNHTSAVTVELGGKKKKTPDHWSSASFISEYKASLCRFQAVCIVWITNIFLSVEMRWALSFDGCFF